MATPNLVERRATPTTTPNLVERATTPTTTPNIVERDRRTSSHHLGDAEPPTTTPILGGDGDDFDEREDGTSTRREDGTRTFVERDFDERDFDELDVGDPPTTSNELYPHPHYRIEEVRKAEGRNTSAYHYFGLSEREKVEEIYWSRMFAVDGML